MDQISLLQSQIEEQAKTIELLESLLREIPGHLYWMDMSNTFLGCNHLQAQSAGLSSPQEIVGKKNCDMLWHEHAEALDDINKSVLNTGTPHVTEETAMTEHGLRHYLSHKRPLHNLSKEIIGLVGISIDITEEKALREALLVEKEKALSASRAKSEFIANMSHDLRTPLTGISGLSEHLQLLAQQQTQQGSDAPTTPLPAAPNAFAADVSAQAADILQSAQALLAFCNTVLSVAKRDKQQARAEPMLFRLTDLLDHQIHLFQPSAQHKGIALSYTLSEVPKQLCGPAQVIERILMNLIGNAIKFTPSGAVHLAVSLEAADQTQSGTPLETASACVLSVAVSDTGIGIPDDQQTLIFDQFTRLSPSFEAVYEGSGLGLYSVLQYLSQINGSISVESTLDVGSCFTITVPCTLPTEQTESPDYLPLADHPNRPTPIDNSANKITNAAPITSKPSRPILLVEDHPIAAKAASLLLQSLDCEVTHAATGEQALAYAAAHCYDFILLDIGLPGIDGLTVAARIRALRSGSANTPIAALTGHADDPDTTVAAEQVGITQVLTKPANLASLSALLATCQNLSEPPQ
jgi:PAS domain S-box-containing protein